MIVSVLKEIQNSEYRVALTPEGASRLIARGHRVLVQRGAGAGSGFADEDYHKVGAELTKDAAAACRTADLVLKVKQPEPTELPLFRAGQVLFSYIHAQTRPWLLDGLLAARVTAIAYEGVETTDGRRPLLAPMSQIAGHMAVIIGGQFLQRHHGGIGAMIGRAEGVPPSLVIILGGGEAGTRAAQAAAGLGASVVLYELSDKRREILRQIIPSSQVEILPVNQSDLAARLRSAVLLINATTWPAHTKEHLVTRQMVRSMPRGAVIVDVTADIAGAIETSHRHGSHSAPIFEEEGVLHYVVPNIPGAVPRTATLALTAATFPFVQEIADKGVLKALRENEALRKGLNCHDGQCTSQSLAAQHGKKWSAIEEALGWTHSHRGAD